MLISQMCEMRESNKIREQKGKSKTIARLKVGMRNEKMTRPWPLSLSFSFVPPLFISLCISLSFFISSFLPMFLSLCVCVCACVCVCVSLSLSLFLPLFLSFSLSLSVSLSLSLFISHALPLPLSLSLSLFLSVSLIMSIYLFILYLPSSRDPQPSSPCQRPVEGIQRKRERESERGRAEIVKVRYKNDTINEWTSMERKGK